MIDAEPEFYPKAGPEPRCPQTFVAFAAFCSNFLGIGDRARDLPRSRLGNAVRQTLRYLLFKIILVLETERAIYPEAASETWWAKPFVTFATFCSKLS